MPTVPRCAGETRTRRLVDIRVARVEGDALACIGRDVHAIQGRDLVRAGHVVVLERPAVLAPFPGAPPEPAEPMDGGVTAWHVRAATSMTYRVAFGRRRCRPAARTDSVDLRTNRRRRVQGEDADAALIDARHQQLLGIGRPDDAWSGGLARSNASRKPLRLAVRVETHAVGGELHGVARGTRALPTRCSSQRTPPTANQATRLRPPNGAGMMWERSRIARDRSQPSLAVLNRSVFSPFRNVNV